jgi:hypothetical protein
VSEREEQQTITDPFAGDRIMVRRLPQPGGDPLILVKLNSAGFRMLAAGEVPRSWLTEPLSQLACRLLIEAQTRRHRWRTVGWTTSTLT